MQVLQPYYIVPLAGLILLFVIAGPSFPSGKGGIDNSIYATLLDKHLENGLVDYAGFKADEDKLDRYLDILSAVEVSELTRNQQFAFYVNAYNAWTIKLILTQYPEIDSIKDIGGWFSGPWDKKFVKINGRVVTLDHIEHDILRPVFGDPRVHFAVNCASLGCPPLYPEPFEGDRLDQQLDRATRQFINERQENYLKGKTLYVSRIFKWFAEDFDNEIVGFFIEYADPPLKEKLKENKDRIRVRYLDYDWSLNDAGSGGA